MQDDVHKRIVQIQRCTGTAATSEFKLITEVEADPHVEQRGAFRFKEMLGTHGTCTNASKAVFSISDHRHERALKRPHHNPIMNPRGSGARLGKCQCVAHRSRTYSQLVKNECKQKSSLSQVLVPI